MPESPTPRIYLPSLLLMAAALLSVAWGASAEAQEWTRFRGPNGSGQSDAQSIPVTWTQQDYHWRVTLPGRGHSSPVVWEDRVFLTTADDEGRKMIVLGIDSKTGRTVWRRDVDSSEYGIHRQNSFASGTPTVDEHHVYVAWATPEVYRVMAFDHHGQTVWTADLGPFHSMHGFGTSPVVFEDSLVISMDQRHDDNQPEDAKTSALVALDRMTGDRKWRLPRPSTVVAYSTPCVYTPASGPPQMIFNSNANGITSIDPRRGTLNWEYATAFDKRTVSSPLIVGDLIFGTCGSGAGGNYIVALRADDPKEPAYTLDRSVPYVPTSVAYGELLFMWDDTGVVTCVRASDGELVWRKRVGGGRYSSSPVRVADKIYGISADGEVVVLAASPTFRVLGRSSLGETCRSTPAISGGKMYLRTESHLMAIGGEE